MEYYFDSKEFEESSIYKTFMGVNTGRGILKIESSTAFGAYPLSGVEVVISKTFGEDKVIFFQGETNDSGIIDNIVLPTRMIKDDIETVSDIQFTTYDLFANYAKYGVSRKYDVSIFNNIKVIQPIVFSMDELMEGENN